MTVNRSLRRAAVGAFLVVLLGVSGCSGDKRRVVEGSATRNGKPLPPCIVRFHGDNGHLTTALLQNDGTFSMTDVLPGEYKVTILFEQSDEPGTPEGDGPRAKRPKPKAVAPVPAKYLSVATTDLVFTITPETQRLDLKFD